jgi:hypothetical protein
MRVVLLMLLLVLVLVMVRGFEEGSLLGRRRD